MKIILATGIYPPDIGGPATYVKELALQLKEQGEEVKVVTYGRRTKDKGLRTKDRDSGIGNRTSGFGADSSTLKTHNSELIIVTKTGGPICRWWRYARVLRKVGHDADVVIAFSSVSCGVPLWMSRLKKPKRILRLGGDFLWERFTDSGGTKGLKAFYSEMSNVKCQMSNVHTRMSKVLMGRLLRSFDHIVFSTRMQEELYEEFYAPLPAHSVIENALPEGVPAVHQAHEPFRLLFLGRIVAVKNLASLLSALRSLPDTTLTVAGEGPLLALLTALAREMDVQDRVSVVGPQTGEAKQRLFAEHDVLVLPSFSEVSPNAALEARVAGLPVLLSVATGLSPLLAEGMLLRDLTTPEQIVRALTEVREQYAALAGEAAKEPFQRGWNSVAQDWRNLLSSLA